MIGNWKVDVKTENYTPTSNRKNVKTDASNIEAYLIGHQLYILTSVRFGQEAYWTVM